MPEDRELYQEEWLADLNDHKGVGPKFKHALSCYLCSGQMRRAAQKSTLQLNIIIPGVQAVTVDFNVNMERPFYFVSAGSKIPGVKNVVALGVVLSFISKLFLNAYRRLSREQFKLFAESMKSPSNWDYESRSSAKPKWISRT